MRRTRAPKSLLLVLLLTLVCGSPMSWAHWLGGATHGTPTADATESCHGHAMMGDLAMNDLVAAQAPQPEAAPDPLPCCDGGCQCAAAALAMPPLSAPSRLPPPAFRAPADTATLPAHPLDDTLRPPIR